MDIVLDKEGSSERQKVVYFMLQEEMCHNLMTGTEEPLAVQQLMMKHVKSVSGKHVIYVIENEFREASKAAAPASGVDSET